MAKGVEEILHHLTTAKRGRLGQIMAKSNKPELLLDNDILLNLNVVQKEIKVYKRLYVDFIQFNHSVLLYLKQ